MKTPSHVRVKPEHAEAVADIMELLKELQSNELPHQILHKALHDGLTMRFRKLSALTKGMK